MPPAQGVPHCWTPQTFVSKHLTETLSQIRKGKKGAGVAGSWQRDSGFCPHHHTEWVRKGEGAHFYTNNNVGFMLVVNLVQSLVFFVLSCFVFAFLAESVEEALCRITPI